MGIPLYYIVQPGRGPEHRGLGGLLGAVLPPCGPAARPREVVASGGGLEKWGAQGLWGPDTADLLAPCAAG